MRHSRTNRFFITLACALAVSAAALGAQEQREFKPFDIGISAGLVMPGRIWISAVDDYAVNSVSPMVKAHFDAYLIKTLSMGLYASVTFVALDHMDLSGYPIPAAYNSATAYEVGGSIKPCFWLSETVALKPALEFGYRRMHYDIFTGPGADEANNTNGLDLAGGFELKVEAGSIAPFVNLGIISQPVGGNSYTTVTFPPIFTLAAGVEF